MGSVVTQGASACMNRAGRRLPVFRKFSGKAQVTLLWCARTALSMHSIPGSGLPTPYSPQSHRPSCLGRSHCYATPRNNTVAPQRFQFAALRVDIALHVGRDGTKSRVAMERQPQRIVLQGVPPISVVP